MQSVALQKDAILFACVPMIDAGDAIKMCVREQFDGFALRFISLYDIDGDLLPGRLDTLSGEILSYPELAVRLVAAPV